MKSIKFISKVVFLIICLTVLLAPSFSAFASPSRVVDNANVLSAEEKEALETKLDFLSQELEQDIVVVTENYIDEDEILSYADDFYDYNGYGLGEDFSGILLLVSVENRKFATSTSGEAIGIFSGSKLDSLEAAFKPALKTGDYYGAFNCFADECKVIIENDKVLSPIWILIALIVGAAVAGIVIYKMTSKHKGVKMQAGAANYMLRDTFRLERSRDVFLFSRVTMVRKPQNNGSSGTRTSSSGRSHGGRSGSF